MILDAHIAEDQRIVRTLVGRAILLSTRTKPQSLYHAVLAELAEDTRNTVKEVALLETYERALGVFRAAALELRTQMDVLTLEQRLEAQRSALEQHRALQNPNVGEIAALATEQNDLQRQITDVIFFSNRYALAFAGAVGLALLDEKPAETKSLFSFGADDGSKDRDALTMHLAKTAATDLLRMTAAARSSGESPQDDHFQSTLQCIFTSWTKQFQWSTYQSLANQRGVDQLKLQYGNFSILAGTFKQQCDRVIVDDKFMRITRTDVIAGGELEEKLCDNLKLISAFDVERRGNPYTPAGVIFTHGPPGCGKTYISHAAVRWFADLCRAKGIPLWAFTHSTTDYASHYQNLTANQLNALAGEINAFPGPVVMYVSDADNIFLSRQDPNITVEQRQTLGVYFKMFDGTLIPKNGKFLAILDANYVEGIDDATKSRVFDEVVLVDRFASAKDFAELTKRTLTKGAKFAKELPEEDWMAIGEYLLQSPLSNREISHVVGKLRRVSISDNMVGRSYDEHVQYWQQQIVERLTRDCIIGQFHAYVETRARVEEASQRARMESQYERFRQALQRTPSPPSAGG